MVSQSCYPCYCKNNAPVTTTDYNCKVHALPEHDPVCYNAGSKGCDATKRGTNNTGMDQECVSKRYTSTQANVGTF